MSLAQLLLKQNNAFGTLSDAITSGATSLTLNTGHTMPTTAGNFYAIIWDVTHYQTPFLDPNAEIVLMSYASTNVYNITRAQENTAAAAHPISGQVAMTITAGTLTNDLSILGGHVLDETAIQPGYYIWYNGTTNTYQLHNGSGSNVQLQFGLYANIPASPTVGQTYLATDKNTMYACWSAGTWSEYGGIPQGGIIMWSGAIANIPTGWVFCNGSNGTPDLRNQFIVGAYEDVAGVANTTVTGVDTLSGDGQLPSTSVGVTVTSVETTHTSGGASSTAATPTGTTGSTGTLTLTSTGTVSFGTGSVNVAVYYALAFIMKL